MNWLSLETRGVKGLAEAASQTWFRDIGYSDNYSDGRFANEGNAEDNAIKNELEVTGTAR